MRGPRARGGCWATARSVWLEGTGLHTGIVCRARWVRVPGPLRVRRVDGTVTETVVSLDGALPTARATRLSMQDGRTVETVEHALATVMARGWSRDLTLEVHGPEVPLGDGSALDWCARMEALGPPTEGRTMRVTRAWEGTSEGSTLRLYPGPRAVVVWTDFTAHGLPAERVRWNGGWKEFVEGIAGARTFGFVAEAEALRAAGRARGPSRESVVVYGPGGVPDGRFARPVDRGEPARHKLLDAIGDLGLVGGLIEGEVTLTRPGHARTLGLLREAVAAGVLVPDGTAPG